MFQPKNAPCFLGFSFLTDIQKILVLQQFIKPFQFVEYAQWPLITNFPSNWCSLYLLGSLNHEPSLNPNWSFCFLRWKVKLSTVKASLYLCLFTYYRKEDGGPTSVSLCNEFSTISLPSYLLKSKLCFSFPQMLNKIGYFILLTVWQFSSYQK